MIVKILKKNRLKNANIFVEPDEIFLDSKNLENFDQQQFEGRIEKPIRQRTVVLIGVFFFAICLVFFGRLFHLQVKKGQAYLERSQNNTLSQVIIFAERGIIYDRNKIELAWNKKGEENLEKEETTPETFPMRAYLSPGFSHLLGYVSSPSKDKSGKYWQTEYVGKDGLEKQYNKEIEGINGSKIVETDAHREIHSQNMVNAPKRGRELITSIDSKVQGKLYNLISDFAQKNNFQGGAGVIMDIRNGELLASTSFPEYSGEVLSLGEDKTKITEYATDKRKVYLDRTISGLYTPGSIVKPFFAFGALSEGVIDPYKEILSTGSLSLPNPYDKEHPTIFRDWKAHGWTDMSEAIAVSSDVYFYTIGGGFEGQKGIGVLNLEKYARLFGIGEKTGIDLPDEKGGVIPNPDWKLKTFKGDPWRIGDTYHTAIGQYGFQVTPVEMVRATGALANGGILQVPHFILNDKDKEKEAKNLNLREDYLKAVTDGMREAVTLGTAASLNVPYVEVAAKTGTAQTGVGNKKMNSWVIGFFPYDNPMYAFTILMESGPSTNQTGASWIMRGLIDYMYWETPEYLGLPKREVKEEPSEVPDIPSTEEIIETPSAVPEIEN